MSVVIYIIDLGIFQGETAANPGINKAGDAIRWRCALDHNNMVACAKFWAAKACFAGFEAVDNLEPDDRAPGGSRLPFLQTFPAGQKALSGRHWFLCRQRCLFPPGWRRSSSKASLAGIVRRTETPGCSWHLFWSVVQSCAATRVDATNIAQATNRKLCTIGTVIVRDQCKHVRWDHEKMKWSTPGAKCWTTVNRQWCVQQTPAWRRRRKRSIIV